MLEIYPGQSKAVELNTLVGADFVIPNGATVAALLVNTVKTELANLTPTIVDAAKGLIRITLPDTRMVRDHESQTCYFDLMLNLPDGTRRFIAIIPMRIAYSPSAPTLPL